MGDDRCGMLGFRVPRPQQPVAGSMRPWGHITSSGTVANIEALGPRATREPLLLAHSRHPAWLWGYNTDLARANALNLRVFWHCSIVERQVYGHAFVDAFCRRPSLNGRADLTAMDLWTTETERVMPSRR